MYCLYLVGGKSSTEERKGTHAALKSFNIVSENDDSSFSFLRARCYEQKISL